MSLENNENELSSFLKLWGLKRIKNPDRKKFQFWKPKFIKNPDYDTTELISIEVIKGNRNEKNQIIF